MFNSKDFPSCTKKSILFGDYDTQILSGFLGVEFSQEDLLFLQKKQKRNSVISLAYLEDGYSQIEIANHLRLSKSAVSMVI